MQYHRHPDGSIDFDFYRARAKTMRAEAIHEAGGTLRRQSKNAAASVSTVFSKALGALLDRMFPNETPRPWAR